MKTVKFELVKCKVCGGLYKRALKRFTHMGRRGIHKGVRGFKTVTCSKKCSREWNYNNKRWKKKNKRKVNRR